VEEKAPMTKPRLLKETEALPLEVKTLLERSHAGDTSILPQLRKAFDDYPELTTMLGDLARHAEEAVLSLIAGPSASGREAVRRHAEALREELLADAPGPLGQLLVQRLVLSTLWLGQAELDLADRLLRGDDASPGCREALRRLNAAHQRQLTAARSLAWLRKLLPRPRSVVEVLSRPVPEGPPTLQPHSRLAAMSEGGLQLVR
jgi:hypothetical protein